jgi:hypothetical protein
MRTARGLRRTITILVGFAADERGRGVAYGRLSGAAVAPKLLRTEFSVGPFEGKPSHAVAYAALTAVARAVARLGISRARFVVPDAAFADEIVTGTGVGEALAIPYVRLRCVLNAFADFSVTVAEADDLTQRARAEVALNIAA